MSTTRTAARQAVAGELGGYAPGQVLGVATASTLPMPSSVLSTELPNTALAYQWALVPSMIAVGLAQARITQTGLNGATGVVTLEHPLGGIPANGALVELHSKLPPIGGTQRQGGLLSVDECVNLALRHLLVPDDTGVTLTLVSGQQDYSLTPWQWLDRPSRLVDVRQPNALGTSYVPTHHRWELRESGRGPTLHFPNPYRFTSGSYSVRLDVRRPGDTLIRVGGTWGDSTVGLVNETDAASPDLNTIVTAALPFCYRTLRDNAAPSARAKYADLYGPSVADARRLRLWDSDRDPFSDVPSEQPAAAGKAA
jgi:hypothetical protein